MHAKIPQIRKYKVNARIDIPGQPGQLNILVLLRSGLIMRKLKQLRFKTPEFLEGALRDEPNWAASWQTIVLDTDAFESFGADPGDQEFPEYKILFFHRKKPDISFQVFQDLYLGDYTESLQSAQIPNIVRILSCLPKKRLYEGGAAPPFDAVTHLSANSMLELKAMVASPELQVFLDPQHGGLSESWGLVTMAVRSEWILGPEARPYPSNL